MAHDDLETAFLLKKYQDAEAAGDTATMNQVAGFYGTQQAAKSQKKDDLTTALLGGIGAPGAGLGGIFGLGGGGGAGDTQTATENTAVQAAPRTAEGTQIWSDFMNQYAGLEDQFAQNLQQQNALTGQYSGAMADIGAQLQAPESQVSFGLEGFDPVSFTQRPAINTANTLAGLAGQGYSAEYGNVDRNLDYFNQVNQLAQAEEQRRFGLPQTQQTATAPVQQPTFLEQIAPLVEVGTSIAPFLI